MSRQTFVHTAERALAFGAGFAAAACAAYAGATWLRYGHADQEDDEERDPLTDQFIPSYEIAERHRIRVSAPADVTFAAACEVDLQESPLVRTIFRSREVLLGADRDRSDRPRGLLALTQSLGWGVLAEVPGREVVVGAVTQPWKANVVFRSLPPDQFLAFNEPGYVKIVWTLRADPTGPNESVARTETRVTTTDATARKRFRRYWAIFSPGILIIRRTALSLVKADAERRVRKGAHGDRFDLVSSGDLDPQC